MPSETTLDLVISQIRQGLLPSDEVVLHSAQLGDFGRQEVWTHLGQRCRRRPDAAMDRTIRASIHEMLDLWMVRAM
jgi:hypothetical protein